MNLWDQIKSFKTQNAQQLVYARIPAARTDVPAGPPIAAYHGYVRLFLADMFLSQSRQWFTDQFPCVTASVRLDLEGQPGAALSRVCQPPRDALAAGVRINYALTDLLPFSGNLLEIEAGLFALKGERYLNAALDLIEGLSSLVTGPAAAAVSIAAKVVSGMESIVAAGDGKVVLGLHDTFGSQGGHNPLQSGYLAIISAPLAQIQPACLGVAQNRLHIQAPNGTWSALQGFDYMLFFVEARTERDNWRLPAIQTRLDEALEAMLLDDPKAEACKKAALLAALTCKELTPVDRRRVAAALKEELAAAADAGHGATGEGARDLDAIVNKHGASASRSFADDVPTEEQILGLA
jgi:hypothetical protein